MIVLVVLSILLCSNGAFAEDGKWMVNLSFGGRLSAKSTLSLQNVVRFSFARLRGDYQADWQMDDRGKFVSYNDITNMLSKMNSEIAVFKKKNPGTKTTVIMSLIGHGNIENGRYYMTLNPNVPQLGHVDISSLFSMLDVENLLVVMNSCHGGGLVCDIKANDHIFNNLMEQAETNNKQLRIITPTHSNLSVNEYDWERVLLKTNAELSMNLNGDDVVSYNEWKSTLLKNAYESYSFFPEGLWKEQEHLQKFFDSGLDPQLLETTDKDFDLYLTEEGSAKKVRGESPIRKESGGEYLKKLAGEVNKIRRQETLLLKKMLGMNLPELQEFINGKDQRILRRAAYILTHDYLPDNDLKFKMLTELYKVFSTKGGLMKILYYLNNADDFGSEELKREFCTYLQEKVMTMTDGNELIQAIGFLRKNSDNKVKYFKNLAVGAKSSRARLYAWQNIVEYDLKFDLHNLLPLIEGDSSDSLRAGLIYLLVQEGYSSPQTLQLMNEVVRQNNVGLLQLSALNYLATLYPDEKNYNLFLNKFKELLATDGIDVSIRGSYLNKLIGMPSEEVEKYLLSYLPLETDPYIQRELVLELLQRGYYQEIYQFIGSLNNWNLVTGYVNVLTSTFVPGVIPFLEQLITRAPNPGEQNKLIMIIQGLRSRGGHCDRYMRGY